MLYFYLVRRRDSPDFRLGRRAGKEIFIFVDEDVPVQFQIVSVIADKSLDKDDAGNDVVLFCLQGS